MDRRTEEKLDKILKVVTRTETQVEELRLHDTHTRVTRLETAHKFWKMIVLWVPTGLSALVGMIVGLLKIFDRI